MSTTSIMGWIIACVVAWFAAHLSIAIWRVTGATYVEYSQIITDGLLRPLYGHMVALVESVSAETAFRLRLGEVTARDADGVWYPAVMALYMIVAKSIWDGVRRLMWL